METSRAAAEMIATAAAAVAQAATEKGKGAEAAVTPLGDGESPTEKTTIRMEGQAMTAEIADKHRNSEADNSRAATKSRASKVANATMRARRNVVTGPMTAASRAIRTCLKSKSGARGRKAEDRNQPALT
jgi:hypothetical protein